MNEMSFHVVFAGLLFLVGTDYSNQAARSSFPEDSVYSVNADGSGLLGVIRRPVAADGQFQFVLLNRSGNVLASHFLEDLKSRPWPRILHAWSHDDVWLLLAVWAQEGELVSRAGYLRMSTGEYEVLDAWSGPPPLRVAVTEDGFVVLGAHTSGGYTEYDLCAYTRAGTLRWKITSQPGGVGLLSTPRDIAVCDDGAIAVLDVVRKRVQILSEEGDSLRSIDLEESSGVALSYPDRLVVYNGGFIVRDGREQIIALNEQFGLDRVVNLHNVGISSSDPLEIMVAPEAGASCLMVVRSTPLTVPGIFGGL